MFDANAPHSATPKMLDPEPWVSHHGRHEDADPAGWDFDVYFTFAPRPEYSQNIEDYQ